MCVQASLTLARIAEEFRPGKCSHCNELYSSRSTEREICECERCHAHTPNLRMYDGRRICPTCAVDNGLCYVDDCTEDGVRHLHGPPVPMCPAHAAAHDDRAWERSDAGRQVAELADRLRARAVGDVVRLLAQHGATHPGRTCEACTEGARTLTLPRCGGCGGLSPQDPCSACADGAA